MYPLLIASLGAFLLAFYIATTHPAEVEQRNQVVGEVAATNFWAYRHAVVLHLIANPSATGTIPDSALNWPLGFIRNPNWSNVVDSGSGTLFVYSSAPLDSHVVNAVANYGQRSMLIGRAKANHTMDSLNGGAQNIVLPPVIPENAIVVLGK